jgi:23S rRNA (adenine2503-C2)-methyltransferase
VGCAFCHTGTLGLKRNLEPWEIVEQFRIASEVLRDEVHSITRSPDHPITNVVFMGMGEPLHNMDNVVQACRIFGEGVGAGLSRRHIVVSTVGVGNKLRQFWETGVASLAISLHATTDELRAQLVPVSRQWDLAALRQILLDIPWRSRESVTIAYLLLDGVNDTHADAQRLAKWLAGMPAKLNLLEFNPYPGSCYRRAGPEKLAAFRQWLYELGVFNTLRHSRGGDVLAACGQLAGRVSFSPPYDEGVQKGGVFPF